MTRRLSLFQKMDLTVSRFRWGFGFVAVLGGLAGLRLEGWAGSTASGGGTRPKENPNSWADPEREVCSFGCLYEKANENLGLQTKYMVHKLGALESLRSADDRANALRSFCLDNESAETCYKRYKKLQIYALKKIHSAMKQNYDAAAAVSNEKSSKEFLRSYAEGVVNGKAPEAKPQAPYVVTFEDLQNEYAKLRMLASNGYQQWADKIPFEPSPEDFVKFTEKPRDPENPAAGTFMVLERDKDGKIKIDKEAYQAALDKYHKTMDEELERMGKVTTVHGKAVAPKAASPDLKVQTGALNVKAFEDARVIRIESSIPKGGKLSVTSQGGLDIAGKGSPAGKKPAGPATAAATIQDKSGGKAGDATSRKPAEAEVKVVTPEDLKKQGVKSLYYSPKEIGELIDKLEAEFLPSSPPAK